MHSVSPEILREWMREERAIFLVDVREDFEREVFHIGGHHLPMSALASRWEELRQELPLVVYCAKGIRSAILIQRMESVAGMPEMYNLEGGMKRWNTDFPDGQEPSGLRTVQS